MEYGLDDLAVGAGENLAENGTGNLDEDRLAFEAVQASRLKPGGVGVDADPGLDKFEEPVPHIRSLRLTANLRSSRHCHQSRHKPKRGAFPQSVKNLWKQLVP